jgi:hypothetical protein
MLKKPAWGIRMRRLVIAKLLVMLTVSALVLLATPVVAARAQTDFYSVSAIQAFMGRYKPHKDAARVPGAIKKLSELGALREPENAGMWVGFLSGVLASDPVNADRVIAAIGTLPAEDQWIVARAIAWSGLPDWRDVMRRAAPRLPAREVMVKRYLDNKLPRLEQLDLTLADPGFWGRMKKSVGLSEAKKKKTNAQLLEPGPEVLDALWGRYYATRNYQPVSSILAMLPMSKNRDDNERLTLGSMAKLTIAINASRDPDLLAMIKRARSYQSKAVNAVLDEAIEAADTANVSPIRSEAQAALTDLRGKGPQSSRNMAWWGKVGEGALSLGILSPAVKRHADMI